MFERFTRQARAAVVEAAAAAEGMGSGRIGREHVLIGLAEAHEPTLTSAGFNAATLTAQLAAIQVARTEPDAEALAAVGIDLEAVRSAVEEHFGPDAWQAAAGGAPAERGWITRLLPGRSDLSGKHRLTPGARKTLELGLREALAHSSPEITATHLLLGLLRDPDARATALIASRTSPAELRALATASMPAA